LSPAGHTRSVDLRSVGKRMTDPAESLAQRVAERAVDLIVQALDVNALMQRVDLNAVLDQVDLNEVLKKVDVPALVEQVDIGKIVDSIDIDDVLSRVDIGAVLERVDLNALVQSIDVESLVKQTDLGAVIASSSGGIASEALDAVRSQAVGLDKFIDYWVWRLRRGGPRPPGPAALTDGRAEL
jgi:hypothetical protein